MFNDLKVLDVHGHCSAPLSLYTPSLLMMAVNTSLPSAVRAGSMGPILPFDLEELVPAAENHVEALDRRQIDVQLLGPRPVLHVGWMQQHLLEAHSQLTNDLIDAQCKLAPERFIGAAHLPQQASAPDAHHMLPEFNRCVEILGFGAAYVSPDPDGLRTAPGMHSAYWDPLYSRAVALDVPLIVHATPSRDPRAEDLYLNYQLSFTTEHYLATEFLRRGHVFDRHPDLRILVCHCGGALDRHVKADALHMNQDDFTANLFFDTCAFDPDFLTAAIRQRGVDAMCFGSEVPGPVTDMRSNGRPVDDLVSTIDEFEWLTEADKTMVFHDNPRMFCKAFESKI